MTDDTPQHPGRILFDQVMTPLGVSRNKLARDIDVPVGRISDIVAGKRGITPDTALRLAKYFGTTPELWLRLQAEFDLHVVRTTSWAKAEVKVAVFEPAPGQEASAPAPVETREPSAAQAPETPATPSPDPEAPETPETPAPTVPGAPEPESRPEGHEDSRPAPSSSDEADDMPPDEDDDIDIPEPVPGGGRY